MFHGTPSRPLRTLVLTTALTSVSIACTDELTVGGDVPDAGTETVANDGSPADDTSSTAAADGDGDGGRMANANSPAVGEVRRARIDATSEQDWAHFDLESGQVVHIDAGWDIALRRFSIKLNGGVSGDRDVAALALKDARFESLEQAPAGDYEGDAPDGQDADEDPDYVLSSGESSWYAYDPASHALAPRPLLYVIRSDAGSYFKLQVLDYYNDAGTSGHISLRYARLRDPEAP